MTNAGRGSCTAPRHTRPATPARPWRTPQWVLVLVNRVHTQHDSHFNAAFPHPLLLSLPGASVLPGATFAVCAAGGWPTDRSRRGGEGFQLGFFVRVVT